jgi:DNA-binding transcriptional MerR regulator
MQTLTRAAALGIREVSGLTGLSMATLRWYEREGLLPLVDRTPDGRRSYPPAAVQFVRLVQALRRTGMPVSDVREFVRLGGGTLANHPIRMDLLQRQNAAIEAQMDQLRADKDVIQDKIEHYQDLIDRGLDCEDEIAGRTDG